MDTTLSAVLLSSTNSVIQTVTSPTITSNSSRFTLNGNTGPFGLPKKQAKSETEFLQQKLAERERMKRKAEFEEQEQKRRAERDMAKKAKQTSRKIDELESKLELLHSGGEYSSGGEKTKRHHHHHHKTSKRDKERSDREKERLMAAELLRERMREKKQQNLASKQPIAIDTLATVPLQSSLTPKGTIMIHRSPTLLSPPASLPHSASLSLGAGSSSVGSFSLCSPTTTVADEKLNSASKLQSSTTTTTFCDKTYSVQSPPSLTPPPSVGAVSPHSCDEKATDLVTQSVKMPRSENGVTNVAVNVDDPVSSKVNDKHHYQHLANDIIGISESNSNTNRARRKS